MAGIDYGRGKTNIDFETGIRYGIIHLNNISGEMVGEFVQPELPPCCPECGSEHLVEDDNNDLCCSDCGHELEYGEEYPDEYDGPLVYHDGDYDLQLDTYGDVWVFRSPFKALGAYCSPCAPGAVSLGKGDDDYGYCLGEEWFDSYHKTPYKVEKV